MNKINFLICLILLSAISFHAKADSINVIGNVSGTWYADTVNVIGNIQLRETESLEVLPGTLVLFRGEYSFEVNGSIKALGTASAPVTFTMADTTGFSIDTIPDGGWKQIRIEDILSTVDSSIFSHCDFSFGKAIDADSIHGYGGALCIRNSQKVLISNCSFHHNYAYYSGGAVYLEDASIRVEDCNFESNRCGQTIVDYGYGGGLCTDRGEPLIKQNTFSLNSSTGIGGGLCVRFNDCMVSHNIFDNNFSALGGGLGILHIDSCKYVISNNLVINNGATFFGAGISNNDCSPTYVNNTITDNHCDGGGGGFYCKDSVVPILINNILVNNTQYGGESNQVYLWDLLSQPNFYYNNIEGGPTSFSGTGGSAFYGVYENNMDENPLFETGLYSLQPESPCVNAGDPDTSGLFIPEKDLAGYQRIVGNLIDMGAYENQSPLEVKEQLISQNEVLSLYPTPASQHVELILKLKNQNRVTIQILNSKGQLIETICNEVLNAGYHKLLYNIPSRLQDGIYFVHADVSGSGHVKKMVILK